METKFKRTAMCGSLRANDIGNEVVLNGWVAKERNLGALIFIDLRDATGISQVVVRKEETPDLYELAEDIRGEFVIAVRGIVSERESKNPNMDTGDIEILATEIKVLDKAKTTPIYVKDDDNVSETMRLKYRYLDLRKQSMQKNLRLRAKTAKVIRDFLYENDFVEVETPFLTNPTPEGARDYLVPSRVNEQKFYALPQSPQQLKQMLMVGGVDRYYQIVKCFRDEDLRANRQPEFTQVDIEMSFVDMEDVIEVNEKLVQRVFKEIKGIDLEIPFKRMSYEEAMDLYGVDKPDLRFGFELKDIAYAFRETSFGVFKSAIDEGKVIKAINIGEYESEYSRKKIDKLTDFVKDYGAKGLIWIKFHDGEMSSSISKFLNENEVEEVKKIFGIDKNGLVFIVADEADIANASLGNLRVKIAKDMDLIDNENYNILWITDFPMFEYSEEEKRYTAKHHPFTKPVQEDIEFMSTEPERCKAMAYDLVINGDEIGGGSIRINNSELQNKVFEALKLTDDEIEKKFGYFIEALSYGTPPHGGIAYGFDRLIMLLAGTDNIKDVIAFPKTQSATCLLTGAPSPVGKEQLEELHIELRNNG
ncbi:MAG: aspartate--tRNA ligase [Tissierellia bacterium]|nr:aspartate--tRNA ligase [Tissierellia bacterium]